jgi:hypothetical protein
MTNYESLGTCSTANDVFMEESANPIFHEHYKAKSQCVSTPRSRDEYLPPGVNISFGSLTTPRKRRKQVDGILTNSLAVIPT